MSHVVRTAEAVGRAIARDEARAPDAPAPTQQYSEAWDVDLVDYHSCGVSAMAIRNPPHPGVNIREGWMVDGMSVSEAAAWIGVPPSTLGRVLDGREGISPELALRLEAAGWSRSDLWLRLQAAYDKARARIRRERRELPQHDQLRPAHAPQG